MQDQSIIRIWNKSISKRQARRKAAAQCLLPVVSLPSENGCILTIGIIGIKYD